MFEAPASAPMELRDYFAILRRRAWVVIVVALIVVGAAAAWSLTRPNEYQASGTLVLSSTSGTGPDLDTQVRIIQSTAVHVLALKQFADATGVVAGQNGTGSSVTVTAESSDPQVAAKSVNAHMSAYVQYLRDQAQNLYTSVSTDLQPQIAALQQQLAAIDAQTALGLQSPQLTAQRNTVSAQLAPLQSQLQNLQLGAALAGRDVEVVSPAEPPAQRTSPKPQTDILVALGAGLLLGVAVAFLLEFLDDSIRSREDLLAAAGGGVPIMGVIPAARSSHAEVVSITAPQSPAAEAYRSLRTAVNFAPLDGANCIEVTSPRSRDGKTETLANLAVLAAGAGQRVVVVDCDFRYPRVHEYFGLPNDIGFTSVVHGELLSNALQRVPGVERLYVLPSGPIPSNPSELMASDRCHEVLSSLQSDDTLVIVDTPPLLVVTDAAALAPSAGGVLIVAAARVTRRKQVRQALDVLRQISAPLLGLVLTGADSAETGGYGRGAGRRERKHARRQAEPAVRRSEPSAG